METRPLKRALFISILVLSIFSAATFLPWAWAAISNISGIAVQGSSIQWNNLKDASQGDDLTNGVPATALYGYDGTNWDRLLGTTANGLDVDVTRVQGTVTTTSTGTKTPTDAYANPTTAVDSWALGGVFNGTTWDRRRSATADALASTGLAATGLMGYNGATWDRLRSDTTNGLDVDVTRVSGTVATTSTGAITPADAYANPTTAIQSWSLLGGYNGTTWDRLRSDTTNGLDVDVTRVQGTVTKTPAGTGFYSIKHTGIDNSASVNLAFGFTSKTVQIETDPANTLAVVVDWIGGTAVAPAADTAGDDVVASGRIITLDDYAVTSISVIATTSAAQTITVRAWQ